MLYSQLDRAPLPRRPLYTGSNCPLGKLRDIALASVMSLIHQKLRLRTHGDDDVNEKGPIQFKWDNQLAGLVHGSLNKYLIDIPGNGCPLEDGRQDFE